jgi:hypothetical protein
LLSDSTRIRGISGLFIDWARPKRALRYALEVTFWLFSLRGNWLSHSMLIIFWILFSSLRSSLLSRAALQAEILALRHQLLDGGPLS